MKLHRRYVEKPWGRTELPAMFDAPQGKRIGEVWFTNGADLPLLGKYIFTSERLSIQVHPNDKQARARGLAHGKSECWYILNADPGATLGLGLNREVRKNELRQAAIDGSIEQLLDWRPVSAGDFIFVEAGTIHAIGGGISLLEFQQNADVTYRLYDYGRARELHLDDGIEVASATPYEQTIRHLSGNDQGTLVNGPHFELVLTREDALTNRTRWVIPLEGRVRSAADDAGPGDCLLVEAGDALATEGARMLVGAKP